MKIDEILDTDDMAQLAGLVVKLNAELNRMFALHKKACIEIDGLKDRIRNLEGHDDTSATETEN